MNIHYPLSPALSHEGRGSRNLFALCLFAITTMFCGHASAQQDWPSKNIRMIAPQAAGGGPERVIRGIAQGLSQKLGQQVIVDYKPGAAGNLGAADLIRSGADGYTWMLGPENIATINPLVYKSTGFDRKELMPFNLIASLNQILACHPNVQASTIPELVKVSKARKLTYSSSGAGSIGQLTMEMFLNDAGATMTHIPYKGPSQAVQDLLGGQVDCTFVVTAALVEHVKAKRLIGIATSSKARVPSLPDMPTMAEAGMPSFDGNFWLVMYAPRGVPQAVRDKFGKALDEVIRGAEVQDAMAQNNTILAGTTSDAAQAEIAKSAAKWEAVAKRIKLELD